MQAEHGQPRGLVASSRALRRRPRRAWLFAGRVLSYLDVGVNFDRDIVFVSSALESCYDRRGLEPRDERDA